MPGLIHLVKLSVGTTDVADLAAWQQAQAERMRDRRPRHVTRMWPRREAELLGGGSIYWVIKGTLICRQLVVALEEVAGDDGTPHCALVLDPALVRVEPQRRGPFQGWRYLTPADAPRDLARARAGETPLPPSLSEALAELGVR